MWRFFGHWVARLVFVIQSLDAIVQPGHHALERVELLLMVEQRPVQRFEIALQMSDKQLELDDAIGKRG